MPTADRRNRATTPACTAPEKGRSLQSQGESNNDRIGAGNRSESAEGLLTAGELAELLALPQSWVYAEARAERIPHLRLGRYLRFRWAEIEQWLEIRERGPRAIDGWKEI